MYNEIQEQNYGSDHMAKGMLRKGAVPWVASQGAQSSGVKDLVQVFEKQPLASVKPEVEDRMNPDAEQSLACAAGFSSSSVPC